MEVEQKLGKSLDDLIKQQRTAKAARPAKKAAGKVRESRNNFAI